MSHLPCDRVGGQFGALALVALLAAPAVRAAAPAYDDATDAAYTDGWQTGDNGGSGWGGPWLLLSGGFAIASSTANGDGDGNADGDVDIGGLAFALPTSGTEDLDAIRPLDGSAGVGERIAFDLDPDAIGAGGLFSVELLDAMGTSRLSFGWYGAAGAFGLYDAMIGVQTLPIPYTDEGLHVRVDLTGPDSYELAVTPRGGTPTLRSGTLAGSGGIVNFRVGAIGDGSPRQSFVNAIRVAESARAAGGLAACAALLAAQHFARPRRA